MFFLTISESILLFFSGFGLLQGILLASILYFHPKSDRSVTSFLALYIFFISIPILMPLGQHLFSWQAIIFIEPFTVLIGPLLYFYVRSFKETITWKKAWPHLIIFVVYLFIAYELYIEVGSKYPVSNQVPKEATKHPLSYIPVTIRLLQRLFYYFLALRSLNAYQKSIRHIFSETSRISLNWVRWLINGYLLVAIITIILYGMILRYPEYFSMWVLTIGLFVSIYIYLATINGITQTTVWQIKPDRGREKLEEDMMEAEKIEEESTLIANASDAKTGQFNPKINEIISKVVHLLGNEKLYQEPELTLQDLADKLQTPSYQVSQAINEGMKKNFYDLINSYRVEEAKRLLLIPGNRNYTILSVGFEAGFNSKTTFNTVFKKFTGLTPTDYRDQQKQPAL